MRLAGPAVDERLVPGGLARDYVCRSPRRVEMPERAVMQGSCNSPKGSRMHECLTPALVFAPYATCCCCKKTTGVLNASEACIAVRRRLAKIRQTLARSTRASARWWGAGEFKIAFVLVSLASMSSAYGSYSLNSLKSCIGDYIGQYSRVTKGDTKSLGL